MRCWFLRKAFISSWALLNCLSFDNVLVSVFFLFFFFMILRSKAPGRILLLAILLFFFRVVSSEFCVDVVLHFFSLISYCFFLRK